MALDVRVCCERQPIGESSLTFSASYTKVFNHESQQYLGDPIIDQFQPRLRLRDPAQQGERERDVRNGPVQRDAACAAPRRTRELGRRRIHSGEHPA